MTSNEQDAHVTAFLAADRQRGFALDAAPLMRISLLQLGADLYRFVWSFHHILLDGWSVARLNKEVTDVFDALCDGLPCDSAGTTVSLLHGLQSRSGQR